MNYHLNVKNLFAEVKLWRQFKRMSGATKVFMFIGLLPLIIASLLSACAIYCTLFFFKAASSPLQYLHNIVNKEGKEVKHATQFVIYAISWPFIFFCYTIISLLAITFYFQWFELMICVYLATLGGVKWQPFLTDLNFETNETYDVRPGKVGRTIFLTLLLIFDFALAIGILFVPTLASIGLVGIAVMLLIINPLVFRKKIINNAEEIF